VIALGLIIVVFTGNSAQVSVSLEYKFKAYAKTQ